MNEIMEQFNLLNIKSQLEILISLIDSFDKEESKKFHKMALDDYKVLKTKLVLCEETIKRIESNNPELKVELK